MGIDPVTHKPYSQMLSDSGSNSNKNAIKLVGSVELNHDVVHHILTLLPVDKREFIKEFRLEPMEFADTVDHVFRFYKGPKIQSFHIHVDPDHDYVVRITLKKWVSKCKEKGIEELDLEVFAIERFLDYFIASRVLDVETLKVLKLTFCVFTLSPLGKCLSLIITLILTRVKSLNNTSKLYSITTSSSKPWTWHGVKGFEIWWWHTVPKEISGVEDCQQRLKR
ncbi:hypothetical protein ACFX11_025585 [Malus domestica]